MGSKINEARMMIGWEKMAEIVPSILDQIKSSNVKYDVVVGVDRGGLPLSITVSKFFDLPHSIISVRYKNEAVMDIDTEEDSGKYLLYCEEIIGRQELEKARSVLVVDENCDSGYIHVNIEKWLKEKFKNIETIDSAVIYYWENELYKPKYYYKIPEKRFIFFPWGG